MTSFFKEALDRAICAEIPDQMRNPRLFEIVTRCMMHGPCGKLNPKSICMEKNVCRKSHPKEFIERTQLNQKGYPLYRRRVNVEAEIRGHILGNSWVVPYNPYLLLKYNAHINVDACTSLRAVKCIYKYVYKYGHDCSNLSVQSGADGDEVRNFVNGRYVSAIEAMWRILENPMHDKSHSVVRLPVHLPNQQAVCFEEGQPAQAFLRAEVRRTKLIQYFQLNDSDPVAREYTYTDIPYHYVNSNGKWKIKKEHKIVPKMYTVSIQENERFYHRLLLLHRNGPRSFEDLEGVILPLFQVAAIELGLLDTDMEWDRCLEKAVVFQMPAQMRQLFAFVMLYCAPQHCRALWDKFKYDMIDYPQCNSMERNYNFALNDINCLLKGHQRCCSDFALPMPVGVFNDIENATIMIWSAERQI
ncbi:hypothetical protein J437_LFUL016347 [Ladona fulva]|uniref:Helitron helicase-like domain-containing protein n=1 Tax=Ladona fulva TaxID=123851 RepID=A0A8K0KLL5_LADFU|nr:hypothetical protein J437_LFUL016347 [Ladona fulva]